MLQDSCEDLVLKNTSAWEMTSSIKGLAPPKSITNAMCPRLCNDRGRCINGTCKCRRGILEFLRSFYEIPRLDRVGLMANILNSNTLQRVAFSLQLRERGAERKKVPTAQSPCVCAGSVSPVFILNRLDL